MNERKNIPRIARYPVQIVTGHAGSSTAELIVRAVGLGLVIAWFCIAIMEAPW